VKGRYLEGEVVEFRTAADRRKLVGHAIRFVRSCDIDKSGRGYVFPRVAFIEGAKGSQLLFDNGDSVHVGDLREVQIIDF
jgi:hypothetical protein